MDKILLVDDVKLLREMQRGLLATSPVHVLTASDGHQALAVARKELPNLIIMDNHMPNIDGVTCCRQLKTDPQLKHIPVIMLTNDVKPADFEDYMAAGSSDCLSKPIDRKQFLSTVKKYIPSVECRRTRVPLSTEVRLIANEGFHVGMTKDIGVKGIHVTSELQPLPGEEIQFAFVLPGSEAPTEVRGKVAWAREKNVAVKSGLNGEFGVEFIEVTGKGLPFIRKSELESFVALYSRAVFAGTG